MLEPETIVLDDALSERAYQIHTAATAAGLHQGWSDSVAAALAERRAAAAEPAAPEPADSTASDL